MLVRDRGKHAVWRSPTGRMATVPRHREIPRGTVHGICRGLGIPKPW